MIVRPLAIIEQTYHELLPARFDSHAATVMLLAIGLQESKFVHRTQIGGPARGFWQFERGGGVRGVLTHRSTERYAESVCLLRRVPAGAETVYKAIADDDLLACAFARLLLWSSPGALPTTTSAAWNYYNALWRPGKPHPETWDGYFAHAVALATQEEK